MISDRDNENPAISFIDFIDKEIRVYLSDLTKCINIKFSEDALMDNNNNNFNEELNKKFNDKIEDNEKLYKKINDEIEDNEKLYKEINDAMSDIPETPETTEDAEVGVEIDTEALLNTIKSSLKESLAAAGILTKVGLDAAKVGAKSGFVVVKAGAKDLASTIKKNIDEMKAARDAEDCDCDCGDSDCDCGCDCESTDCFGELFTGKKNETVTMSSKESKAEEEKRETLKYITSRIDMVIANMKNTVDTLMSIDGPMAAEKISAFGNIATESEVTNQSILKLLNKMYDDITSDESKN